MSREFVFCIRTTADVEQLTATEEERMALGNDCGEETVAFI
jgi:hypothetical protein